MPVDSRRCRPFNLGDGMILIAATAVGLWGQRYSHDVSTQPGTIASAYESVSPILLALPLGFLVVRLRQPRLKRRRLMMQPGLVACLSILIYGCTILMLVSVTSIKRKGLSPQAIDVALHDIFNASIFNGFVVIVTWSLFCFSGRMRRERGWIDRLGVFLGIGWIVATLATLYESS